MLTGVGDMAARFGGLNLEYVWRCLGAGVLSLLVTMPAIAGTNLWTASNFIFMDNCETDGQPTIAAAVSCFEHLPYDAGGWCGAGEVKGTGPPFVSMRRQYKYSFPYDCSTPVWTGYVDWFFEESCTSIGRVWNADIGGCAQSCGPTATPDPLTGDCGPPSTEIPGKRADKNGGVCKGHPCDILTGTKIQRETDHAPGTGVLAFARTYNSLPYHPAKEGPYGKPLGESWFGSYLQFISADSGLSSTVVHAVRPNGDVIEFAATVPGSTSTQYEAEGELRER